MTDFFADNYTIVSRTDSVGRLYSRKPKDKVLLRKFHRRQVWQIVEDGDATYARPGKSDVNSVGYFITFEGWRHRGEAYFI